MLRRIQAVCFSPLALYNGWASKEKLWTHENVKEDIRAAIVLRLRLLPYFYNAFAQYHFQGTPVIRPMQLAVGLAASESQVAGKLDATTNPYEIPPAVREVKDQYFFGDSLLIAPIAAVDRDGKRITGRKVVLPAGKWYDFHTGKFAGENETIEVTPLLSQMPVFVKDGAIIPMLAGNPQHAPAAGAVVGLEVRHYGQSAGKLMLYDDDGETFDFEKGGYSWTELTVSPDTDGKLTGKINPDGSARQWSYGEVRWTFMSTR
jgi:alpha-D-xyloside xylohydrolase